MKHVCVPIELGTFGSAVEMTLEIILKLWNYVRHALMTPVGSHESE